jgi:hypothetical protein
VLYKSYPESESHTGDVYAVRDCHENTQRNFDNLHDLQMYLDKTYQFEQMTVVDGVAIPEFSNIEFITIENPFELIVIDPDLVDDVIEEEKDFKTTDVEQTLSNNTSISTDTNTTSIITPPTPNSASQTNYDQFVSYSVNYDDECDDYVQFI